MFRKKDAFKNFSKFTGKYLCQSRFFNKVVVVGIATLLKETPTQVFSCEFWEIFKNTFFYRTPSVAASKGCKYMSLSISMEQ